MCIGVGIKIGRRWIKEDDIHTYSYVPTRIRTYIDRYFK